MQFLLVGDSAVSVQFGQEISMELSTKVRALQYSLETQPASGIKEVVPTYASLMVHYEPEIIMYAELIKLLKERIASSDAQILPKTKVIEVPICYGGAYGPDLEECAKMENIMVEEFIQVHSGSEYYTYMIGFAPGHPYMARATHPFSFQRREFPRIRIEAGSVVVSQNLSNLIPFAQPSGWNVIGATPLTICDYEKENPFLVNAGQWVKFVPINEGEYKRIKQEVSKGTYKVRTFDKAVDR